MCFGFYSISVVENVIEVKHVWIIQWIMEWNQELCYFLSFKVSFIKMLNLSQSNVIKFLNTVELKWVTMDLVQRELSLDGIG